MNLDVDNSLDYRSNNSTSYISQSLNQNKNKKLNQQKKHHNLNSRSNEYNDYNKKALINENNHKGNQYSGNTAINSNINVRFPIVPINGIYEANMIHNPNFNLVNYNTLLASAPGLMQSQISTGFSNTQNQLYLNPYNINQNLIGQQYPVTLNIGSHQSVPGSIPVNIQTNGNYLYNFVPGINNSMNQQYQKANFNLGNLNMFLPLNGDFYVQGILLTYFLKGIFIIFKFFLIFKIYVSITKILF